MRINKKFFVEAVGLFLSLVSLSGASPVEGSECPGRDQTPSKLTFSTVLQWDADGDCTVADSDSLVEEVVQQAIVWSEQQIPLWVSNVTSSQIVVNQVEAEIEQEEQSDEFRLRRSYRGSYKCGVCFSDNSDYFTTPKTSENGEEEEKKVFIETALASLKTSQEEQVVQMNQIKASFLQAQEEEKQAFEGLWNAKQAKLNQEKEDMRKEYEAKKDQLQKTLSNKEFKKAKDLFNGELVEKKKDWDERFASYKADFAKAKEDLGKRQATKKNDLAQAAEELKVNHMMQRQQQEQVAVTEFEKASAAALVDDTSYVNDVAMALDEFEVVLADAIAANLTAAFSGKCYSDTDVLVDFADVQLE